MSLAVNTPTRSYAFATRCGASVYKVTEAKMATTLEQARDAVLRQMRALANPYHNDRHVMDVVAWADEASGHIVPLLTEEAREDLLLAALYHDAGHCGKALRNICSGEVPFKNLSNEQYAVLIMNRDLAHLPVKRLNCIAGMILSTTFGVSPHPHPA